MTVEPIRIRQPFGRYETRRQRLVSRGLMAAARKPEAIAAGWQRKIVGVRAVAFATDEKRRAGWPARYADAVLRFANGLARARTDEQQRAGLAAWWAILATGPHINEAAEAWHNSTTGRRHSAPLEMGSGSDAETV